jgi:hypothetical protein
MTADDAVQLALDHVLTALTHAGRVRPGAPARWTAPLERTPGWVQGRLVAPIRGRLGAGEVRLTVRAPRWAGGRPWVLLRWTRAPLGYWWTARWQLADAAALADDSRLRAVLADVGRAVDRSVVRRSLDRAYRPQQTSATRDRAFRAGLRVV